MKAFWLVETVVVPIKCRLLWTWLLLTHGMLGCGTSIPAAPSLLNSIVFLPVKKVRHLHLGWCGSAGWSVVPLVEKLRVRSPVRVNIQIAGVILGGLPRNPGQTHTLDA